MSEPKLDREAMAIVNKKLGTQFNNQEELRRFLRKKLCEFDETYLEDYFRLNQE